MRAVLMGDYVSLWSLSRRRLRSEEDYREFQAFLGNAQSFSEAHQDWGLLKMTIAKGRRLIATSGFKIVNVSTGHLPISMIRWPILSEIFTWHA